MKKMMIIVAFVSLLCVASKNVAMDQKPRLLIQLPISQLEQTIIFHSDSLCKSIMTKNPGIEHESSGTYCLGDKYFPLHIAVAEDNITAAEQFLALSTVNNSKTSVAQNTALHLVRTKEMAKKLQKSGIDVMDRNARGETPLLHISFDMHGYGKKGFLKPDEKNSIIHYLLKHNSDLINATVDSQGNTLLHVAATNQNCDLTRFLLERNANPEIFNAQGETPVAIAMKRGYLGILRELRKAGIFVMSDESYQNNILYPLKDDAAYLRNLIWKQGTDCCALNRIAELLIFLKQYKPDGSQKPAVSIYSIEGPESLWHCFQNASIAHLEELVGKSSIEFAQESLTSLCTDAAYEIDNHITPQMAVLNNYESEHVDSHNRLKECFILRHPFVLHYDKKIVFEMLSGTIIRNDMEMFEFLLSNKPDLRCTGKSGDTLLHTAMVYKNAKAVELLVKNGIDLTMTDDNGHTVLRMANEPGYEECLAVLQRTFFDKLFSTPSYGKEYQHLKKFLKNGADIKYIEREHLLNSKKRYFLAKYLNKAELIKHLEKMEIV